MEFIDLIIYLIGFGILYFIIIKLEKLLNYLASKTETEIDDIFIKNTKPYFAIFVLILYTYLFLNSKINNFSNTLLAKFLMSLIYLDILLYILKLIDFISDNITKVDLKVKDIRLFRTAISLLSNITKVIVAFIGILMILSLYKINITPILASAGLVGIAIGFALKDILENVLSGILIFLDPPFKIGDTIRINNYAGTVVDIGLRNTKIKTFDGNIITIPNSKVINQDLENWHLPIDVVRVELKIGVDYKHDPEYVKKVIKEEILDKVDTILKNPEPSVLFLKYGDFALEFSIRFWVKLENKMSTIDKVNTLIWKVFKEKNIEIPYPIRKIYLEK